MTSTGDTSRRAILNASSVALSRLSSLSLPVSPTACAAAVVLVATVAATVAAPT